MIVHHGRKSPLAELHLSAIVSSTGEIVQQGLRWQLQSSNKEYSSSEDVTAVFSLNPDKYLLEVFYEDNLVHHRNIILRPHTMVDITIIIGKFKAGDLGDEFDISQDNDFDDVSCYQQRAMERDGERQLENAGFNGSMRTPVVDNSDFDPAALPSEKAGCGSAVKGHPKLQVPQFSGDPQTSPAADSSSDVANQPQMSPAPNPGPSAAPSAAPTPSPRG